MKETTASLGGINLMNNTLMHIWTKQRTYHRNIAVYTHNTDLEFKLGENRTQNLTT